MDKKDKRWQQRFENYQRALLQLTNFMEKKSLNELEEQGLIQAFEYTHELAWKTLADFIKSKGNNEIFGSKDTTREAFSLALIGCGEIWMNMTESRNMTSHTYNKSTTDKIIKHIRGEYFIAFKSLEEKLTSLL